MAQDVRQWLDEIKRLKQQLTEVQRERDAALESANQWRQLYSTEAQQRREEVKRNQEIIGALRSQLEQLEQKFSVPQSEILSKVTINREIERLHSEDEMKAKLVQVMLERDRARDQIRQLSESLEQEKANHLQTRNSLTTALGDTVDLLTKAKGQSSSSPGETKPKIELLPPEAFEDHSSALTQLPQGTQLPLPQLPPMDESED
jgi:predicted  nucleic acid-binding Zn-ribbon protein